MAYIVNNREIAPCIVSKARFALGIKQTPPTNDKRCSQSYWDEVVEFFGNKNGVSKNQIAAAKKRTDLFR